MHYLMQVHQTPEAVVAVLVVGLAQAALVAAE
jgi:hypothetical protein